jgi:hypothetical protein
MKRTLLFCAGLLLCSPGFAQGDDATEAKQQVFSVGVQLRPRAEYRNGVLSPRDKNDEAAAFINNRARLTVGFESERLTASLSAQQTGVWGQDPGVDKEGRLSLNEAWVNINLGKGFFAKMGRQDLMYDDDRLLGSLDWNVAGRFHDGLKLGYETGVNKLHLITAFNQNDEKAIGGTYYAPGGQPYKSMLTGWYQHVFCKELNVSFLAMNIGREGGNDEDKRSDTKYLQTVGTNISYKPGDFTLYGTFYYQTGKTVTNRLVSAYMWAVNATWQADPAWRLLLASDYLSGSRSGSIHSKAFDPLYGTHHKFYGTMDYFYASNFSYGLTPGLWDNQVGVTFKASPKVSLLLNYHYFSTTADVFVGGEKQGRALGSELDFQINWSIMKDVSLSAGYSTMLATDAMKAVKGGHPGSWQDWGWLSVNVNPKVFLSKW